MYNKIYDFCKIRNIGNVYQNESDSVTPRVQFLLDLLESEGISYELDKFNLKSGWVKKKVKSQFGYNIILKGTSNKMVVAHHDVSNPNIDNANDNSASVINAIMLKKILPEINVVILDGEEVGGLGSQRCSELINDGYFGEINWVLNLELTGKGGKHFFIGNYPGKLYDHIKSIFNCPVYQTPFNDSVVFRKNGIDSVVINPLPPISEGKSPIIWSDDVFLDHTLLFNCHSERDSIDSIDVKDMQEFVEQVLVKILS
jgi:hypothetical protein